MQRWPWKQVPDGVRGRIGAAICSVLLALALPAEARRVALLVGISQYRDAEVKPLAGPRHDVAALRDVLQRRWGFAAADIRTLTDTEASRAAILTELDALSRRSAPGDELLIYFSGHGISALSQASMDRLVPYGSGAFLAHDFEPKRPEAGGLIVGRTDLLPRLSALEAGQRHLWVIVDSCYSGQSVRQAADTRRRPDAWPERTIRLDRPGFAEHLAATTAPRPPAPPYPYRDTAFLAAAAEGESARDIDTEQLPQWPTLDGRPHGAFTDALLRVLSGQLPADLNADGLLDLHEVHRTVTDFMAQRPYGHTPQRLPAVADDTSGLGSRPVLLARGVAQPPREAPPAPLTVRADGLPAALLKRLEGLPDTRLDPDDSHPADLFLTRRGLSIEITDLSGDLLQQIPAIGTGSATNTDRLTGQIRQLAWARRLRQLAERHQRGVLPVDLEPADLGGNLLVGQQLNVALRPAQAGWLLMINIAADGRLTPLYPTAPFETLALPAGQLWRSPAQRVTPPEGKDLQFMLLFDREPTELAAWVKLARYPDDTALEPLQAMLERMITAESRRFVFGHTEFRTWAAKP